jgi:hypothetical protein
MALYTIMSGVHRSVAAREAGLNAIIAQIEQDGIKVGVKVLPLSTLYSPKATINRWDRGWDFHDLIESMKTVEGRAKLPPIFVVAITTKYSEKQTPLMEVRVLDDTEEISS